MGKYRVVCIDYWYKQESRGRLLRLPVNLKQPWTHNYEALAAAPDLLPHPPYHAVQLEGVGLSS